MVAEVVLNPNLDQQDLRMIMKMSHNMLIRHNLTIHIHLNNDLNLNPRRMNTMAGKVIMKSWIYHMKGQFGLKIMQNHLKGH